MKKKLTWARSPLADKARGVRWHRRRAESTGTEGAQTPLAEKDAESIDAKVCGVHWQRRRAKSAGTEGRGVHWHRRHAESAGREGRRVHWCGGAWT